MFAIAKKEQSTQATSVVKGHILYMSKRCIEPGEEVTVDYKFSPHVEKFLCHCGSARCRGTINLSKEQFAKLARRSKRRKQKR